MITIRLLLTYKPGERIRLYLLSVCELHFISSLPSQLPQPSLIPHLHSSFSERSEGKSTAPLYY